MPAWTLAVGPKPPAERERELREVAAAHGVDAASIESTRRRLAALSAESRRLAERQREIAQQVAKLQAELASLEERRRSLGAPAPDK